MPISTDPKEDLSRKYCLNCLNFIRGTVVDPTENSQINTRYLDVDRCIETHYRVKEYTFCLIPKKFKEK